MSLSVFISYQRADEAHASFLASELESRDVTVWWDAKIPKGDDWRERIVAALSTSNLVVLLHSGAAERSEEVRNELAVARAEGKRIVAIQLENRKPSGAFLYEMARFNWVPAYVDTKQRIAGLALRLSEVDPASPPGAFVAAINARKLTAPLILQLANSNLAILTMWLAAVVGGFAFHDLMGEGYSSLATENGLLLSDLALSVAAIVVGAPLFLLRFAMASPATLAELGMLGCAALIVLAYVLLFRNLLRAIGRLLTAAAARRKKARA